VNKFQIIKNIGIIGLLLVVEISNPRMRWNALQTGDARWRVALFAILLWCIAFLGTFGSNAFIYFQF